MRSSILSLLLCSGPPVEPEVVEVVPVPAPERASEPSVEADPIPVTLPQPEREQALASTPPNLHVHWEVDLPLMLGASAVWLGTELFSERLVPASPRWTRASAGDLALRDALTWRSPATARQLSDVFAAGVVPLFGLTLTLADIGTTRQWRVLHEDLLVVAEAVTVAGVLTQALKLSTARGRPYTYEVYDGSSDADVDHLLVYEADAFLSFPSAHASVAFAFASSFATVATLRQRKLAPYLWGLGLPLAGFSAYLRVAAHRHWFSDVVIGSTLGSVVGAGLPLLLHHPRFGLLARLTALERPLDVRVLPSASGATVIGRF
jgi:membrane-associated phospholipid phosphatase